MLAAIATDEQPPGRDSGEDDRPELPPGEWPTPPRKTQSERTREILAQYREPTRRFPWRIAVYSLLLAYLAFDLYVLDGPLRRRIDAARAGSEVMRQRSIDEGWVAVVNGEPVTAAQLDRAIAIYHYRRGTDPATQSPESRRIARLAVLEELIEDEILRTHVERDPVPVDPSKIDAALEDFEGQFPNRAALRLNLRAQHIDPDELRGLVAAQVRQLAWIEYNIAAGITVSEEEARAWFDAHRDRFRLPERVRARQIFLSTVDGDTPEREALIIELHRRLTDEGADFGALAAEFSDDHRSKNSGGDLNYFSRKRLPADFAEPVFAQETGTLGAPFRTSIGWHLVEVTDRRPARDARFEEADAEIRSLLEAEKREITVREIIKRLKKNSVVQLYPAAFEVDGEKEPAPPADGVKN